LNETVTFLGAGGGVAVIPAAGWPGVAATITAAIGSSAVMVSDLRGGTSREWHWNGSDYIQRNDLLTEVGSTTSYSTLQVLSTSTVVSSSAAATLTCTGCIPAGAVVVGVTSEVITVFSGSVASTLIGVSGDTNMFGNAIATAAGTTTSNADWTITTVPFFAAATDIILTGNVNFGATGAMRINVFYLAPTAP